MHAPLALANHESRSISACLSISQNADRIRQWISVTSDRQNPFGSLIHNNNVCETEGESDTAAVAGIARGRGHSPAASGVYLVGRSRTRPRLYCRSHRAGSKPPASTDLCLTAESTARLFLRPAQKRLMPIINSISKTNRNQLLALRSIASSRNFRVESDSAKKTVDQIFHTTEISASLPYV